ncbi:hypothetical protein EG835_13965, partial [bacterium]|nr:hypothetical protein [bacterium]
MLRPHLRLPLWAAAAIPAAAYLLRSALWGTLQPRLPEDAVVFGALLIGLTLAATLGTAAQRRGAHAHDELH